MISVQTPGGPKGIGSVSVLGPSGSIAIGAASVLTAGGSVAFFAPGGPGAFVVTTDKDSVYGGSVFGDSTTVVTEEVTANPPDSAAYTYAWEVVDAGTGSWSINTATSRKTSFSCGFVFSGSGVSATFQCVVTDSRGRVGISPIVTAYAINYGEIFSGVVF